MALEHRVAMVGHEHEQLFVATAIHTRKKEFFLCTIVSMAVIANDPSKKVTKACQVYCTKVNKQRVFSMHSIYGCVTKAMEVFKCLR